MVVAGLEAVGDLPSHLHRERFISAAVFDVVIHQKNY